jgi:hypothetical protein
MLPGDKAFVTLGAAVPAVTVRFTLLTVKVPPS